MCMRRGKWNIVDWILGLTLLVGLAACSTIDEDMGDCGEEFEMKYELQLITNIETELQTQLTTGKDVLVADANLGPIPEESKKHLGYLPEKKTRVKRASIEALFFYYKG